MKKKTKKKATRRKMHSAAEEFAAESEYLKGADVTEPFTATIEDVEKREFDGGEMKWVLHLAECKSIVLNKTNGRAVAEACGDLLEEWPGKKVHVFTERRRNPQTGQMQKCISLSGADDGEEDDDEYEYEEDDE